MPARLTYELCKCLLCTEKNGFDQNGAPLGDQIPRSKLKTHLALCEATILERRAAEAAKDAYHKTVGTSFFFSNLYDDMGERQVLSDIGPLLSIAMPEPANGLEEMFSSLNIMDSLPPSWQACSESCESQQAYHRCTVKKEKHRATEKAHTTFNYIEREIMLIRSSLSGDFALTGGQLSAMEMKLFQARKKFEATTRSTPSLETRRTALRKDLAIIDNQLTYQCSQIPKSDLLPKVHDTSEYVELPINSHKPLSQVTIFLAMFCHIICSVGRRPSDFIMSVLQMIVTLAFCRTGKLEAQDQVVLDQIPNNIRAALKKFRLEGKTVLYAVCPSCNKTFPPNFRIGSSIATYKAICDNRLPSTDGFIDCGADLTKAKICNDGSIRSMPIKTFAYHSFVDFVASLLSRRDLELAAEKAMDDIFDPNTGLPKPSPENVKSIFDTEFIWEFKGPDKETLFAHRNGETRLLFSLFVDFFNVNSVLHCGATTSDGIIAMACLNLPLEQRYLPENLYLAGIIPGPKEPTLTELNYFLEPLTQGSIGNKLAGEIR